MLANVEWKVIRSAFIRARGTRKQAEIAKAGDVYQSDISKLESNDNLGPAVETFVKAVEGLGMTVSSFFANIEHVGRHETRSEESRTREGGPSRDHPVSATPEETLDFAVGSAIARIVQAELARQQTPAPRTRRPRGRTSRGKNR